MAKGDATDRRARQRRPVDGADKAQLASAWAAAGHLPKLDAKLIEKALPGGKAQIGAYEVTRVLGEGEFATVYSCVRKSGEGAGAKVACKAIKKSKVERARGGSILKAKRNIGRVNLEVEAMNRLRHEGVCRLYEVVQSSSYVYCFIEAGERDLFSFLDGHPRGCPEPVVVAIARIAALALRHCHQRGIAHRDVKPENVLVQLGVLYLRSLGVCGGFTPSTRVVSIRRGRGLFLFRVRGHSDRVGTAAAVRVATRSEPVR